MEYYLRVSQASYLKSKKDRFLYRILEIFPGALSWTTLVTAFFASMFFPAITALFVIAFVTYWFFRNMYLAFHLRAGYKRMREHEKMNWIEKLDSLDPKSYSI